MKAAFCLALVAFAGVALAQSEYDVLNFALQLECLEANFYKCAATGSPLTAELAGEGAGSVSGCQKATLDTVGVQYVNELMENEVEHVNFLRTALGAEAVPCPAIDIGTAFSAAADAAAGTTLSPPFSPYLNTLFFMHGAYIFEPTGTSAYLGAAPLLANNLTYLGAAAGIYGVEAVHTGIVNTYLGANAETVLPYNVTVAEFIQAIADLENSASGSTYAKGITAMSDGQEVLNLVPVDSTAMITPLEPEQVLKIVTLGSTTGAGGFFPNGLNGYFAPATSTAG